MAKAGSYTSTAKWLHWGMALVLPPLVAPDQSLYDLAKWVHTYTAWLCGALAGGHVLVALKHHFIEKDEVLKGMLASR
ncbi:cytochrome B [Pseudomonas sp. C1C7]|nr:cytochrome B [Pseudomonas sp. C1C7]